MNQILFQFAILLHPPKQNSVLLVPPQTILASKQSTVEIYAARLISDEYLDRLDQIEILIRPYSFSPTLISTCATTSNAVLINSGTSWQPFDYSGSVSSRGTAFGAGATLTVANTLPEWNSAASGPQVVTFADNSANTVYYNAKSLTKQ